MALEAFVAQPLSVALDLNKGGCGGTYREAALIVSGQISAIASFVWPGRGNDRSRYIEAWLLFAPPEALKVSVPLLRTTLHEEKLPEAATLEKTRAHLWGPGNRSRVLRDLDVDLDEATLAKEFPTLDRFLLRKLAYPTLFYEQIRCGLVHEGELGERASWFSYTTREDSRVSYTNPMVATPGIALANADRVQRIHFHLPWLVEIARTMARNADAAVAKANGVIPTPAQWWIAPPRKAAPAKAAKKATKPRPNKK